jgi:hypothetical protein
MPAPRRTLDDVFEDLRLYVADNYPGDAPDHFTLRLRSGREVSLPIPEHLSAALVCSHSPDFRSVVWYGTTYHFTAMQAAVVRLLWEAHEAGSPEVGQAVLLETAGSAGNRVRDLFRNSTAWGEMIVPTGSGTFRLVAPEEPGARAG